MKKSVISLFLCLIAVCLVFSGCSKIDMPTGELSGNGGTVFQKGDYVYFAGAFKDSTALVDGNNKDNEDLSAIYRVKTSEGVISYDDDGKIKDKEKVVSKVTGFANGELFVVGDYVYFLSPNIHKNSSSQNRFDLTTLFKQKLNGDNQKEIYTSTDANAKFYFANFDNKSYCFILNNEELIKIDLTNNKKTTLGSDIKSIVFDKTNSNKIAYFTKARNDQASGNLLKKIDLSSGTVTDVRGEINETFTLNLLKDGVLYYQRATALQSAYYFFNDFSNDFTSETRIISATSITNETAVATTIGNGRVIAYIYESNLFIKTFGDKTYTDIKIDAENSCGAPKNVLLTNGENIFFDTENGIYMVSYKTGEIKKISDSKTIKATGCDFDGKYFYYYATITLDEDEETDLDKEAYYMHRTNTHFAGLENLKVEVL